MKLLLDRKTILKSLFIGVYMTVQGIVLQVSKGILLLEKDPPVPAFLVQVVIFYILTGMLYAYIFFNIRDAIPGKSRIRQGFNYGLLVCGAVVLGFILGMIGMDFEGGFNLFTKAKVENYAVTLIDIINYLVTSLVLGRISGKEKFTPGKLKLNKKVCVLSSIAGFFLFPLIGAGLSLLLRPLIPLGLSMPAGSELWFYVGTYAPLAVCGAFIPLFYLIARRILKGSPLKKAFSFSVIYYLGYCVVGLFFGLPFGLTIITVIHFLIALIPTIFAVMGVTEVILNSFSTGSEYNARELCDETA